MNGRSNSHESSAKNMVSTEILNLVEISKNVEKFIFSDDLFPKGVQVSFALSCLFFLHKVVSTDLFLWILVSASGRSISDLPATSAVFLYLT